jgi:hypothetical protein
MMVFQLAREEQAILPGAYTAAIAAPLMGRAPRLSGE